MARRFVLALYDIMSAVIVACLFSFALVRPAFGYIDPSVMTYTIQAIAGVAVALSTVAGVALRRGRKTLMRILDIDENARRVVEPDVHRTDGLGVQETQDAATGVYAVDDAVSDEYAVEAAALGEHATEASAFGSHAVEDAALFACEGEAEALPQTDDVDSVSQAADGLVASSVEGEQAVADFNTANVVLRPASQRMEAQQDGQGESSSAGEQASSSKKSSRARRRRRKISKPYNPPWKERLVYGAIVAFFFVFTIFFVAPLEIVAGSSSSLIYSLGDVWWVLLAPGLGMAMFITAAFVLLRGRGFSIALLAVAGVGLCAYVQALFLNIGLPAADGATIVWADHMTMQVVSSAVWSFILTLALVFAIIRSRRAQGVAVIVSVFLVLVQAVGLASLVIAPAGGDEEPTGGKVVMTEDQLFTVNPKHNVIVFVLDTYDTAYLSRVLDMNPNLLDGLTGFTNYENATSAMIPTRFAIPEMMTGQMPSFDEAFSTYKKERYARSDFLDKIYGANYSLGLYTDSLTISRLSTAEQYGITSKTVNMHDLPDSMMNVQGTLYCLYQMGLYRDVLWPFKWAFWYYTDQINQSLTLYRDEAPPEETIYVMDDIRYYNRLCDFGLTLEDGDYDGAYRFIHLLGSHYPFCYDEEVNDLGEDNSDVFKQSQGAIKIVTTYIDELKRLGVYENTTIIITADHGYWTITLDPIEETSTPIMFVKPEQSAEADAQPITVDEKPVSHLDLQATILDAMGLDYSEYSERDEWAGYSMFGYIDPDRKRYYLTTDSEPDLTEVQFREYLIDGNALDWENWSETGRTLDAQK